MLKGKRGIGLQVTLFVLVFMFATAIFLVVLYHSWTQMADPLEESINNALPDDSSFNMSQMTDRISLGVGLFDAMFPFLVLGLIIMATVSVFFIESHPIFFFISLILVVTVILLGVVFGNIFQQLTENETLSDAGAEFDITTLFMKNLPIIITIVIAVVMVILFAMSRSRGATGGL
jgi:hypothetical protein